MDEPWELRGWRERRAGFLSCAQGDTWTTVAPVVDGVIGGYPGIALGPDGRVYVSGGQIVPACPLSCDYTSSVIDYSISANTWY